MINRTEEAIKENETKLRQLHEINSILEKSSSYDEFLKNIDPLFIGDHGLGLREKAIIQHEYAKGIDLHKQWH